MSKQHSAKAGMVHSVSGWTRGVQVKLWDPLRTRAIPERLRGVFMTRRYTNTRLPLLSVKFCKLILWQQVIKRHRRAEIYNLKKHRRRHESRLFVVVQWEQIQQGWLLFGAEVVQFDSPQLTSRGGTCLLGTTASRRRWFMTTGRRHPPSSLTHLVLQQSVATFNHIKYTQWAMKKRATWFSNITLVCFLSDCCASVL